ncbi:MAG: hypothetical protein C0608_08450 [Deltaproteobacteria bacterium]|nr:MAG: hypothetical protein C0608_08450 [Deltaproteobacteria bacterium]
MKKTLHIDLSLGATIKGLSDALEGLGISREERERFVASEARGSTPYCDYMALLEAGSMRPVAGWISDEASLIIAGLVLLNVGKVTRTSLPMPNTLSREIEELLRGERVLKSSANVELEAAMLIKGIASLDVGGELIYEKSSGEAPRLTLGYPDSNVVRELRVIEANLDDLTPELLATLIEVCLRAGALDSWLTPILMKKGRPASKISALCEEGRANAIKVALFKASSTLGVREYSVSRSEALRKVIRVETPWGEVSVKVGILNGELINIAPEFEECRDIATKSGVPLRKVMEFAHKAASGA